MSPMTPEQREEIARTVAANRAFQYALLKKKRGGVEVITITLMPSPDDPPLFSDEYQAELERVGDAFRSGGIEVEIPIIRMDSVEDGGGLIGEFIIPLVKVAPVAVSSAALWVLGCKENFAARRGRKSAMLSLKCR